MMLLPRIPFLFALIFLTSYNDCSRAQTVIQTESGPNIEGVHFLNVNRQIVYQFLGVPYSRNDSFSNRWKQAQPFADKSSSSNGTSEAVWKAVKVKPKCPGREKSYENVSEDCLYLNIQTTTVIPNSLPVFVWLGSDEDYSDGLPTERKLAGVANNLVARGIVMVSVEYRRGIFAHDPFTEEMDYGVQDLILAIRWISKNIRAFGGDSKQISVGGHGISANYLLELTKKGELEGLFQTIILQSPHHNSRSATLWRKEQDMKIAKNIDMVLELGTKKPKKCPTNSTKELKKCLSKIPLAEMEKLGLFGNLLPKRDAASSSPKKGRQQQINPKLKAIIGYNQGQTETMESVEELTKELLMLDDDSGPGGGARIVYRYVFDPDSLKKEVPHGFEVPFLLGTVGSFSEIRNFNPTRNDYRLSTILAEFWTNFVKHGDPNSSKSKNFVDWKPVSTPSVRHSSATSRKNEIGSEALQLSYNPHMNTVRILSSSQQILTGDKNRTVGNNSSSFQGRVTVDENGFINLYQQKPPSGSMGGNRRQFEDQALESFKNEKVVRQGHNQQKQENNTKSSSSSSSSSNALTTSGDQQQYGGQKAAADREGLDIENRQSFSGRYQAWAFVGFWIVLSMCIILLLACIILLILYMRKPNNKMVLSRSTGRYERT